MEDRQQQTTKEKVKKEKSKTTVTEPEPVIVTVTTESGKGNKKGKQPKSITITSTPTKIAFVYHDHWNQQPTNPKIKALWDGFHAGVSQVHGAELVDMRITFNVQGQVQSPVREELLSGGYSAFIFGCQNHSSVPDYLTLKFITDHVSVDPKHQEYPWIPVFAWVSTGLEEGGGREAGDCLLRVLANQGMLRMSVEKYFPAINGIVVRSQKKEEESKEQYNTYLGKITEYAMIHGKNLARLAQKDLKTSMSMRSLEGMNEQVLDSLFEGDQEKLQRFDSTVDQVNLDSRLISVVESTLAPFKELRGRTTLPLGLTNAIRWQCRQATDAKLV